MNVARMLAAYGGISSLVYIETASFTTDAPFLQTLPLITLSLLTLNTTMQRHQRALTAASFLFCALATYLLSPSSPWVSYSALLHALADLVYLVSLLPAVKAWSLPLTVVALLYFSAFVSFCFADIFFSIPLLVVLLSIAIATSCLLFVASGSICQHGVHGDLDAQQVPLFTSSNLLQASWLRFAGSVLRVACDSAYVVALFGRRSDSVKSYTRVVFYLAEGLFFFANERAF